MLYYFVNNLLGIGQQWLVNRYIARLEAAPRRLDGIHGIRRQGSQDAASAAAEPSAGPLRELDYEILKADARVFSGSAPTWWRALRASG